MKRILISAVVCIAGVGAAEAQQQRKFRANNQGGTQLQYQIQNSNSDLNRNQAARDRVTRGHNTSSSKAFNNNFK